MEALQATEDKIAERRRELQENQHELETLRTKIVSASHTTANTGFQRGQHGHDTTPIRNMLTSFLDALKSGMPSREDEETPTAAWIPFQTHCGAITELGQRHREHRQDTDRCDC